jgi:hypothetical protein
MKRGLCGPVDGYLGGIRSAPSRRIVSPLIIGLRMISSART